MKNSSWLLTLMLICGVLSSNYSAAQDGNQILDGIGETGLIARYIFDGDAKDWSRNNLHAKLEGSETQFFEDKTFGQVLSLYDDQNVFVSFPEMSLASEESLSISCWVYMNSGRKGQILFDLGESPNSHLIVYPVGVKDKDSCQVKIRTTKGIEYICKTRGLEVGKWSHLVVVFDAPSKSVTIYHNAKKAGRLNHLNLDLTNLFGSNLGSNNKLYLGASLLAVKNSLNANLHDFRVYRIPLNEDQVSRIYHNASGDHDEESVQRSKIESEQPKFDPETPQLYNGFLSDIEQIEVETRVGHLPRLPRYVHGSYESDLNGPKVRVIWPAPEDNRDVMEPGSYVLTGRIPGTDFEPKAQVHVIQGKKSVTPDRNLEGFELNQVSLNNYPNGQKTQFVKNRDKFINALAKTNPDDFLYMFRNAFGQEQPEGAKPLGVWDSQETKLRGHATGHYLTAIAQAYDGTNYDKVLQSNFSAKMDYLVNSLYELSQMSGKPTEFGGKHEADPTDIPPGPGKKGYNSNLSIDSIRTDFWNWGEGFISAYPPDQFIMLEHGATYGTQSTQVWAPYYTLHKILVGLMDVYEVSGNEKALEIVEGMGTWVYARLSQLSTDTLIQMWNTYIAGEFGGMNEAMARMYRMTNEPRFLKAAQLFDNIRVFFGDAKHAHGLAKNVDTFRGLHANQHIPQIVGALEIYRDSNKPEYYRVADNFWYKATNDYMYSIGGVAGARNPANAECFVGQPASLYENGFSSGGQNETCATYNMLKLTRGLFLFDQRAAYMDYYERGLYNHILASVAEDSPANTYHVPLRPGSVKSFGNPEMTGFTCCNGTALESNTKLQNSIYFKSKDDNSLYVNLFVPSRLNWKSKNIIVEQKTAFPHGDRSELVISGDGEFDLHIRIPDWASKDCLVKINGVDEKITADPGTYFSVHRKWKDGDTVQIEIPFQFHLDPVMDQQNIASLFYGPILLAAQESEALKEWRKITLDANDIGKSIQGDPKELEFIIDGIIFKPFYETYGRHSVYLDVSLK